VLVLFNDFVKFFLCHLYSSAFLRHFFSHLSHA
jgi:hypothetical protein